ncbi:SRPBCC family protein [Frankia sp. AgB32]|uniref:SRPBCC family protein n=1 Tax=Frankia sp. AgB32 TaxID=631119 RepID=UPI00200EEF53|nr:SRPBCC family protein [Frankia sp. AgB32]MCK9893663.1 SRPBCC family protein [Frankia sp. AgB32]
MLDTTLETSVTIALPVAEVHRFMTTPDHWAPASTVTEQIRGEHTDRPATLGDRFVDVLRLAPDATVEVEWTVTRDEPDVAWQISTDPPATADPADGRVHVTLTYTYAEGPLDADTTLLTRTVRAVYPGTAPLPLPYRDTFTNQAAATSFLTAMRAAMLPSRVSPPVTA